jgi:tetratricopeptide (TPR) repeat protein
METYRISSKLRESEHEYLIQTTNDSSTGSVSTAVFIDGQPTETVSCSHPDQISPQEVLSLVKLAHGEKRQEIEMLLKAHKEVLVGGSEDLACQLGTVLYYKRFLREAADIFTAVVIGNPGNHLAHNLLGLTHLGLGRIPEAVQESMRAVEARPGYADYRHNLGEAYLAANEADKAAAEFEQAIAINMYYSEAYVNLALAHILRAIDDRQTSVRRVADTVLECINKAAMIDPAYKVRAEFERGVEALQAGDFPQSLSLLKAIREARRETRRQELASYYMRFVLHPGWVTERAVAERIRYLEGQIEKNPSYIDLQAELARCYLEQARFAWSKGVAQYRKTSEMNRSLSKVSEGLAEAQRVMDLINDAIGRINEKG